MLARSVSSGLTRARIGVLRIDLQRELEQLRRDLRQLRPGNVRSAPEWICGDAHAESAECEDRAAKTARCAQVVTALDRIRRGTYGRCSVCKREIPYERLVVAPAANTCETCNVVDSWLWADTD